MGLVKELTVSAIWSRDTQFSDAGYTASTPHPDT
jgi:hypothetical protein